MAILLESIYSELLIIIVLVLTIIHLFYQYHFRYWKSRGVKNLDPTIPFGNIGPVFTGKKQMGLFLRDIYEKYKHHPLVGMYFCFKKGIIVNDLELIKAILVKEFNSFDSHGLGYSVEKDPLANSLFRLHGASWKKLRAKIAPSFTSNKMKYIFETMVQCADKFQIHITEQVEKGNQLEFKEIFSKLNTDIIASCAFGIDSDSFEDPDAEFRRMGKKSQDPSFVKAFYNTSALIFPEHISKFKIKLTEHDVEKFFMKIVRETIKYRDENNVVRQDMMQLLIDIYKKDKETGADDPFTVEDIAAQANFFFIAGFDTSSSAGCFALYELAKNPEVQDRLREEVLRVLKKHDGKLTFEVLAEMTYLGWVIEETLRMYPSAPAMIRICTKECKLPGTEHIIEKGTRVMIPALGIQWDPDLYPEPEKFIPERFSNENKQNRHAFAYLAFGEGPRICMGVRFAMMQLKISILSVIKNFEISTSEKTLDPMVYDAFHIFLIPKSGLYLNLKRLNN